MRPKLIQPATKTSQPYNIYEHHRIQKTTHSKCNEIQKMYGNDTSDRQIDHETYRRQFSYSFLNEIISRTSNRYVTMTIVAKSWGLRTRSESSPNYNPILRQYALLRLYIRSWSNGWSKIKSLSSHILWFSESTYFYHRVETQSWIKFSVRILLNNL